MNWLTRKANHLTDYYNIKFNKEETCETKLEQFNQLCVDYLDDKKLRFLDKQYKKEMDLQPKFLLENCSKKVNLV